MACVNNGVAVRVPGFDDTVRAIGRVLRGPWLFLATRWIELSAIWCLSVAESILAFLKGSAPWASPSYARLFDARGGWFSMQSRIYKCERWRGCPCAVQVFLARRRVGYGEMLREGGQGEPCRGQAL